MLRGSPEEGLIRENVTRLLAEIASLCGGSEEPSGACLARALELSAELRQSLHRLRMPPLNDWRAALAYTYAGMLEKALESRNTQIIRLELVSLHQQWPPAEKAVSA